MKLDDLYYDELQKINENMECPSGMNEAESDDLELPENLESLEEMLCDAEHNKKDNTNQQDQSLYEGYPITVGISMLLIMTVAMRHGMTGEALQDILTLISLHCISPNYCTESLRRFKQYFATAKSPLVFHHYCSHCFLSLDDKGAERCPNTLCQKPLKGLGKKAFFIEIPIVSQLQDLYKQVFIWKTVTSYRFNRERTNDDLGDKYDDALYRQHWDSGFLKDHRNISFIYNTNFQVLEILFMAAVSQLFRRDNMLLAGVWFGPNKPFMLTYLKPFHIIFHQLETNGISIVNPSGEEITVRAILLCARCLVCNSIQFSGFYGCLSASRKIPKNSKGWPCACLPF